MEDSFQYVSQIIIAVAAGLIAQVCGEWLRVPSIVILLVSGLVLGRDCLGILHPNDLGTGLSVLVSLGVAVILFEGGLNLELKELKSVSDSLRNLISLGTLITFAGGACVAHYFADFPWEISVIFASLVVVTGPTVVGPLLKQVKVDRKVATLLEGEGVLIDPIGAIFAVVVLNAVLDKEAGLSAIFIGLTVRLTVGAIVGAVGGWLLGKFLESAKGLSEDVKVLLVLASTWVLFGCAQAIRGESGLMAVVVAGIVLRSFSLPEERLLRRFKNQLTVLFVSVLFVLLSADLSIDSVFALGFGSVGAVLILMLVIRPLSVSLCTANSGLNWRQKVFVAWVAPRGIVSASVASLFAIILTERGVTGGDAAKALVFLTILMTVFIQGLSAKWVARLLGINSNKKGVVIVGSNPLSRMMAHLLEMNGESVLIIDRDLDDCEAARSEKIKAHQGSILDEKLLEALDIDSRGTLLALTSNTEVNQLAAQRVQEDFDLPQVIALLGADNEDNPSPVSSKVSPIFGGGFALKDWNDYLRNHQVRLGLTTLGSQDNDQAWPFEPLMEKAHFLPLLVRREGDLLVVRSLDELKTSDQLIYLLYQNYAQPLARLSGDISGRIYKMETCPEIEALWEERSPPSSPEVA